MIPGVMVGFLERASVAVMATRDADLRPKTRFLCGWWVEDDRETVACLIPREFTDGLIPSLEDNGQIALTAEVIGPHETYQFKGNFVDTRPSGDG